MTVLELSDVFTTVDAPAPTQLRFGLFSVVTPTPDADTSWEGMGITWLSQFCASIGVTYDPCIVDNVDDLAASTYCTQPQYQPFTVYELSEVTTRNEATNEANARARLAEVEQVAVESQLWPLLATAVTEVSAGIGSVLEALAFTEQALGEAYPAQGVIHMSRYAATLLAPDLVREGSRLTTPLGTPVVAGAGYGEISGAAAANVSIYGTGPLVMRRGAVQYVTTRDLTTNRSFALAYRTYVIGWDCAAVGATATT